MPSLFCAMRVYWAVASLATIFLTCLDKSRAKRGRWRIPEATLLLCAALGGAAAMLLTMRLIHHKTRKPKFSVGVPLLLAAHLLLTSLLVWRLST